MSKKKKKKTRKQQQGWGLGHNLAAWLDHRERGLHGGMLNESRGEKREQGEWETSEGRRRERGEPSEEKESRRREEEKLC